MQTSRCRIFLAIFATVTLMTSSFAAPSLAGDEAAPANATFFEVIKTDDVNGMDLMEDLCHAVFTHRDVNLVTVWDIYTLQKIASIEIAAPQCVLCRGNFAYIGSFDGKLTILDSANAWQKNGEVKLPLTGVLTLSAPGGKAFKGHLLALCEYDQKKRQMVVIDSRERKAKAFGTPGELSGAAVDFDGKAYFWQGTGGSPARAIEGIKSWPLLVGGRESPEGQRQYDTLPIIRQVQPGPFWFGGNRICKGLPPTPIGKVRDQFVIPDRSKQLAYIFPDRTMLECVELTGTLETIGTQRVFFPKEHGRFKEMNPHVTCFYDFLSFAVTGRDNKLRIFSYDGQHKLVWTVTVDAFEGADARIAHDPMAAANVPKTAPKAVDASLTPRTASANEVRTWTDITGGFNVDASLVEIVDDKVKLKRTNGKESLVQIAQLSAVDQAFLRTATSTTWVRTTAQNLSQDYTTDRAKADAKYKDKMVEVSGVVLERNRPVGDVVVLHITWPMADREFVMCHLHQSAKVQSVDLWPGQLVSLAGVSLGDPFKPMLDECRFTQIGATPKTENVAAQGIIDDFNADTKAANEKYRGKALILEGIVKKIDKGDQYVLIAGKGDDESSCIIANWGMIYKDKIEAVEKMTIGGSVSLRIICGEKGELDKHIPLEFWAAK